MIIESYTRTTCKLLCKPLYAMRSLQWTLYTDKDDQGLTNWTYSKKPWNVRFDKERKDRCHQKYKKVLRETILITLKNHLKLGQ